MKTMIWAGIVLILAAVTMAAAQPAPGPGSGSGSAAAKKKKIDYKLEPKASPKLKRGKVALAQGTADADPHRLFLENLEILQPVGVTVIAQDPSHDIKVQLGKVDWDKNFDREGSTKGKGHVTFKLRTAGDLKIVITSPDPEPRPFQLVVYVGEVAQPAMLPPVAVKKSAWKPPANAPKAGGSAAVSASPAQGGGGGSNTGIIVAIVLVGLMIVVTMVVLNRRKR